MTSPFPERLQTDGRVKRRREAMKQSQIIKRPVRRDLPAIDTRTPSGRPLPF
jgi:hypothetical protein